MSDLKNVFKGGWHPKGKDGGKESWRGDFKGINQVAGWVGKGKQSGESTQSDHVSRPLATLKDPALFGPPPKNVNYHGGAALPNEITPHRGGLGAPLTQTEIASARAATATPPPQEDGVVSKPAPPPLPFRADSTGLRTDNLPPPPTHKDLGRSSPVPAQRAPRPTPGLPPRLPSRQNTIDPPPPSYENATSQSSSSVLNQSAIDRLGKAGVKVPDLGIGKSNSNSTNTSATAATIPTPSNPWKNEKSQTPSPSMSELQSRFSRMNTSLNNSNTADSAPSPTAPSPSAQTQTQVPSWQQTRHALTTANSAYKDPSSISLADAQTAAQTAQNAQKSANNFREQHKETISAAQTRATQLNKKYNMTGRLNKFLEDANEAHDKQEQAAAQQSVQQQQGQVPVQQQQYQQYQQYQQPAQSPPIAQPSPTPWAAPQQVTSPPPQSSTTELAASISRKPPPPPPPKKPANMQAPPPVPLGTRPTLG